MAGGRELRGELSPSPVDLQVVLVAPQIAGNTGNIVRLCANVGARLHLVEPLGFTLEDKLLRRAGLDYHDFVTVQRHPSWSDALAALGDRPRAAFSARGSGPHTDMTYGPDHVLVFGAEQTGLSDDVLQGFAPSEVRRLPMRPGNRSLNLANACAVVLYEAWRQLGFEGGL